MDISDFIKQINTLGTVTSVRDHKLYRDIRANQKNVSGFKESGAKFSISTGLLYKIFQENPNAKTTELKDDYNITKRDRSAIRAILVALSTPHTHTDVKAKTPTVKSIKDVKIPASTTNKTIKGLDHWSDDESEVLILGTLPSQESVDSKSYYNNKSRNSFWKIMHAIFGKGEDSKEFLLKNHIALWDVFESAPGTGNKDSSRDYTQGVPNKIEEFLDSHKNIKGIILNGVGNTTSWFKEKYPSLLNRNDLKIKSVNNSSNLNSREGKEEEWKQAIDEIKK